jgi:23S rRNA (uracil1939-C5)-methyltransferase
MTSEPHGCGSNSSDLIEAVIERIVPGGYGLGRAATGTVLVALAAPGDRALIRITYRRGTTRFGVIESLIEPGAGRATPPCRYYGRCGGCDFQHLAYDQQIEAKAGIIRDAMRRIGHQGVPANFEMISSPSPLHYRMRAEWRVDCRTSQIGYLARSSNELVGVDRCLVLRPELDDRLRSIPAARGDCEDESLSSVLAIAGDDAVSSWPPMGELYSGEVEVNVGDLPLGLDPRRFFQASRELLDVLVAEAVEPAISLMKSNGTDGQKIAAYDLYCGVGLFALHLAKRVDTVEAVDIDGASIGLARRNAAQSDLHNVRFHASPVDRWLRQHARRAGQLDLVLVDPPRSGLERSVLDSLVQRRPPVIAYVSCDPATFSRDARILRESRYQLTRLRGVDLFPQTHHVEVVGHFVDRSDDIGSTDD